MGSLVTVLTPTRSSGDGSSLGTTGWVRKAGNLWGQWEENRQSDHQAPDVALLMPSRHKAPAAMAQSAASSGGREGAWDRGESWGSLQASHSLLPVLCSFWEEWVAFHSVLHEPLLQRPCLEGSLHGPNSSSSLSFKEFAWGFPIPQTEIIGKWVPADHRNVGVPGQYK